MISHDLRIWLSGFFAAAAVATFVLATVFRIRARAGHEKEDNGKIPARAVPKKSAGKTGTIG
jgi:hypothetical protein